MKSILTSALLGKNLSLHKKSEQTAIKLQRQEPCRCTGHGSTRKLPARPSEGSFFVSRASALGKVLGSEYLMDVAQSSKKFKRQQLGAPAFMEQWKLPVFASLNKMQLCLRHRMPSG